MTNSCNAYYDGANYQIYEKKNLLSVIFIYKGSGIGHPEKGNAIGENINEAEPAHIHGPGKIPGNGNHAKSLCNCRDHIGEKQDQDRCAVLQSEDFRDYKCEFICPQHALAANF